MKNCLFTPSVTLCEGLKELQEERILTDITLRADGNKEFSVHAVVFNAVSSYIGDHISEKPSYNCFILSGASEETVASIIDYTYGNPYAISGKNVDQIYPFAVLLGMKELQKLCEHLKVNLKSSKYSNNKIIPLVDGEPVKSVRKRNRRLPNNSFTESDDDDGKENENRPKAKRTKRTTASANTSKGSDIDFDISQMAANISMMEEDEDEEFTSPQRAPKKIKKQTAPSSRKKKPSKSTDGTVFECGKCKHIFISLEKCNEHMARVHGVKMVSVENEYICSEPDCTYSCTDSEVLREHVNKKHPLSPKASNQVCTVCRKDFLSAEQLEDHIKQHHSQRFQNNTDSDSDTETKKTPKSDSHKIENGTAVDDKGKHQTPKFSRKSVPKSSAKKPKNTAKNSVVSDEDTQYIVEYLDDKRTVYVYDSSLLPGWKRCLIARKDYSKYDLYIMPPDIDGKKSRRLKSLKELAAYLHENEIEMETRHISYSMRQLCIDACVKDPSELIAENNDNVHVDADDEDTEPHDDQENSQDAIVEENNDDGEKGSEMNGELAETTDKKSDDLDPTGKDVHNIIGEVYVEETLDNKHDEDDKHNEDDKHEEDDKHNEDDKHKEDDKHNEGDKLDEDDN